MPGGATSTALRATRVVIDVASVRPGDEGGFALRLEESNATWERAAVVGQQARALAFGRGRLQAYQGSIRPIFASAS